MELKAGDMETHLSAFDPLAGFAAIGQILDDGSKWSDTYSPADQHSHFVLVPVLMALAVRPVQVNLQTSVQVSEEYDSVPRWDRVEP